MILLVLCLATMFAGIIIGSIFQKPVSGSILCFLAQALIIVISILAGSSIILVSIELAICVPEIVSLVSAIRSAMHMQQKKHSVAASRQTIAHQPD